MTVLKSVQSQLSSQNCTMVQTVQQNKDILSSNNMSLINLYKSKLTEFRKCPHIPDFPQPSLQTNTDENGEHSVTFGRYTAKLTHTLIGDESYLPKLLMQSEVVAVILTSLQEICRIACLLSDRAWVSGNENTIKCVDIFGFVHYTVKMTSEKYPSDLTLNNDGELLYRFSSQTSEHCQKWRTNSDLVQYPDRMAPRGTALLQIRGHSGQCSDNLRW